MIYVAVKLVNATRPNIGFFLALPSPADGHTNPLRHRRLAESASTLRIGPHSTRAPLGGLIVS
jgi:hypothetical protein